MNRDVFISLLALDSYNRGYGQNVLLNVGDVTSGTNEVGRKIGTALVVEQRIDETAQAAGFYAIAYEWNGETIISYRGTNFPGDFTDPAQLIAALGDVWGGWAPGALIACNSRPSRYVRALH